MKRLIAAGILFVFVIGSYIWGYVFIKDACNIANKYLEECINVYDSESNAEKEAKKLEKYWSKKEKGLSFFANHSDIDEIELAISSLKTYSKTSEKEIFLEYSGTVKTLLHQLMEDTTPNAHSIF